MVPKTCPWTQRTGVDAKLMQRTGLDGFTLTRLRRAFHQHVGVVIYAEKHRLATSGTAPRFKVMQKLIEDVLTLNQQAAWREYIGHNSHRPER